MFAESIPILFIVLLGFGMLWILWRLVRRLFRPAERRSEPVIEAYSEREIPPGASVAGPVAAPSSTIPDAADVLALKAAIDNLARQVSALESRLASGSNPVQVPQPAPPVRVVERAPASPNAPTVIADHRL